MEDQVVYILVAFWEKASCTIIADYPKEANYFRSITSAIIDDLHDLEDENVSVNKGKYTVHVLVSELRYAYVTQNENASSSNSFFQPNSRILLERLRNLYRELPILADLSMDLNDFFISELSEPLKRIMKEHNNQEFDKTSILVEELSEVRKMLMEAIRNLMNRGQKLEELARKTQSLKIAVRTKVQERKQPTKKPNYVMVLASIAVFTLFLSFTLIVFLYIRTLRNS